MTNDKGPMTKESPIFKPQPNAAKIVWALGLGHSLVIRHSEFVISAASTP
jgi:hypothetical protein